MKVEAYVCIEEKCSLCQHTVLALRPLETPDPVKCPNCRKFAVYGDSGKQFPVVAEIDDNWTCLIVGKLPRSKETGLSIALKSPN